MCSYPERDLGAPDTIAGMTL